LDPNIQTPSGLKHIELDAFLPNHSIALEYQGETHYFSSHIFGRASDRKRLDQNKLQFATKMGITLISIPFWWDKSSRSLAATIRSVRPDCQFNVESSPSDVIAANMPTKLHNQFKYIPVLPKKYDETVEPTGWYVDKMIV
jgi:hypothetical protein